MLMTLTGGDAIAFEDSRVFGSVNLHATRELPNVFASYGPEPLDAAFTWQSLRDSAGNSRIGVKPFLLDQSRVVGLGNIWAAESCFRAGLSPFRPVNAIANAEWKRLHGAIRRTLEGAIAATFKVTRASGRIPGGGPADLRRLRPRGRALPEVQGRHRAQDPSRAQHLLLPRLPEVVSCHR